MSEQRVNMPARVPLSLYKRFKAALAIEGIQAQTFFERVALEFADKVLPLDKWNELGGKEE